jgi:hypothetical protein
MSESPTPSTSTTISADLAAAAERRLQQRQASSTSELQFTGPEHEQRQKFRRLIDPGILRPNAEAQALASLKVAALGINSWCHHFYIALNVDIIDHLRKSLA